MINYESIDPDKVKEIFAKSFAINKGTGEVVKCSNLPCNLCLFYENECGKARLKWLDQPVFDPEKDIDWSKVPVDTPVIVGNSEETAKRYFCRISEEGYFYTFAYGTTSWSSSHVHQERWSHCKLYSLEDVEKYRKKEAEK